MIIVDIIFNCVMGSINNGGCLLMISTIKKIVIHAAIAALALISVNTSDVYAAGKNAKFNVTFIYGTTINTQQVKRGKDAIVPVDTFVPGFTFAGWTDTKLKNLFKYHTNNLYKNGCIHYAYSCHDLRHFFAITEYKKDCDIYRVSKLLGHSSIAITEKYLKGMNVLV